MVEKYINNNLRDFKAYPAKLPIEKIQLAANENPFNILEDEEFRDGYVEVLKNLNINRYPDPNAFELRKELAEYVNTKPENIIVGNGADDVIGMILSTFINPGDVVITHSPSFEMYTVSSIAKGAKVLTIPDIEYRVDTNSVIEAANKENAKMIFLCVPNNPTGYVMPLEEVQKVIDETDALVILDMAYLEFAEENFEDLKLSDRVIMLRTMSKAFGMAALRVGYGIANPDLIGAINLIKPPYNINQLSQDLARYTLKNRDKLNKYIDIIKREKDRVYSEVVNLEYAKILPTSTNFVLLNLDEDKIEEFNKKLIELDMRVKIFTKESGMYGYYRISIGNPDENNTLIEMLKGLK